MTPEQRRVLAFMKQKNVATLTFWVRDEFPVIITVMDIERSEPLAEIFAAKIGYLESDDVHQEYKEGQVRF